MAGNLLGREVEAMDVAQAFVDLAKASKTTALNTIPPPKAHQKVFIERPLAHSSQATLTDDAAHAAADPIIRLLRSACDDQTRPAARTPSAATTAPSAAARAAVFRKAEGPDEAIESNHDSKERAHERPPRRGLETLVEPISQTDAEHAERRELPADAQRESQGVFLAFLRWLGLCRHFRRRRAIIRFVGVPCQFSGKWAILAA